jgi:acyl-CoA thioesterase-1
MNTQYLISENMTIFVALVIFAAFDFSTSRAVPVHRQSEDKNILFFGNSLTAGYGLDPDMAFPGLIQKKIDRAGLDYRVINAGLSGETSAGGLARIDWVLRQPVDVFVLELGANDGLRGLPLQQTKENLQRILEKVKARNAGVKIVVAGMMVPPNMGQEYGGRFVQIYPELASEYDAALIPFLLEGVGGDVALNLPDGIHPNAQGHRIVAETVWKVLQPLL